MLLCGLLPHLWSHKVKPFASVFALVLLQLLDVCCSAAYSPTFGRIALGGSNSVRILDTSSPTFAEIKSDAIDLEPNQVT
jgi:hypothetical protein